MPKGMVKSFAIVTENAIPDNIEANVRAPVYAVKSKVENAISIDEIRAAFRENKPVNVNAPKTVGIMLVSDRADDMFNVVPVKVNVVTFGNEDKVYYSQNVNIIGQNNLAYYLRTDDGEIRMVKKSASFIVA